MGSIAPFVPPDCDIARLDSAVRAVESYACYGEPSDLFDPAAAYAFYISEAQQVFADGHKRTGLGACLDFLKINGVPTENYNDLHLYDWMLQMANKPQPRGVRRKIAPSLRLTEVDRLIHQSLAPGWAVCWKGLSPN